MADLPKVDSLAALQAFDSTNNTTVYLNALGRTGPFAWNPNNVSGYVAADTQTGIWVAPLPSSYAILVSGTMTPNYAGTYTVAGVHNGNNYYQCPGVGFIWYYSGGGFWFLSAALDGNSTNDFFFGSSASVPPLGNWSPQHGATGTATLSGNPGSPLGALGAWQRQYPGVAKDWIWFGAIPDGVTTDPFGILGTGPTIVSGTDNSVALYGWSTLAQYESKTLGIQQVVEPSPSIPGVAGCTGQYNFNGAGVGGLFNLYFASNMHSLWINGKGAVTLQNIYNTAVSGGNFGYSEPFPRACNPGVNTGYLINQTVVGATSFTTTTASDAANITPDTWVMLGSLDVQMNGYPSNLQLCEFVKVKTINASTGVITTYQPLQWQHMTTYPDYNADGSQFACGKARVWLLGSTATSWDTDQVYQGLTINLPPGGGQTYITFSGKHFTLIDCVIPGPSESVTARVVHVRTTAMTNGETDKLIGSISHYDCDFSIVGLGFQSSAPNAMDVHGGRYGGWTGAAKKSYVHGAFIETLQLGNQYGYNDGIVFEACTVNSKTVANSGPDVQDGVFRNALGTYATYSNAAIPGGSVGGLFTLNKAGLNFGIGHWNCVPGMFIAFESVTSDARVTPFPGNTGMGIVTAIGEDSTNYYIQTTLKQTSTPSWATGNILLFKVGQVRFINCTGCDVVRVASEADQKGGYRPWERYAYIFDGVPVAASGFIPANGQLTEVDIDVINPGAVSGATMTLTWQTADATTFVSDSGGIVATINIGVAGKRVWTQTAINKLGTDSLTVGGSTATTLPAGKIFYELATFSFNTVPASITAAPTIRLTMYYDTGMVRTALSNSIYPSNGAILPIQGLLQ